MTDLHLDDNLGPLGANQGIEADDTYVGGKARNRKNVIPRRLRGCGRLSATDVCAASMYREWAAQILKPITSFDGHGTVNQSAEKYIRAAFWHTNMGENFFSIFKRGIYGCYFHVSEKHLHRYAAEFDFRHNNRIALGVDYVARAAASGSPTKQRVSRAGLPRRRSRKRRRPRVPDDPYQLAFPY